MHLCVDALFDFEYHTRGVSGLALLAFREGEFVAYCLYISLSSLVLHTRTVTRLQFPPSADSTGMVPVFLFLSA